MYEYLKLTQSSEDDFFVWPKGIPEDQESAQTNRFSHGIFNLDLGWPYKLM